MAARVKKSERFLEACRDCESVVFVTHDNPDPDAIATGWALKTLVDQRLGLPTRLVGGGVVVRAENRQLLQLLEPPLELVSSPEFAAGTGIVLVDCGPDAANHLLTGTEASALAVIDHHAVAGRRKPQLPFVDLRPSLSASATIAASYLKEQKLTPSERLATAIVYAIRTETRGREAQHSRLDRSMVTWLTPFANPTWVAEIESAPLTRAYYADLVLALQRTFLYDDTALCLLPRAEGPETVGEVADLLVRCDGVARVLCAAAFSDRILVSVRTSRQEDDAAELIRVTLHELGHGGGHHYRAGGCIPEIAAGRITDDMEDDLRGRWLAACQVSRERGTRLVPRRDILACL